jgi:hypothetical protein
MLLWHVAVFENVHPQYLLAISLLRRSRCVSSCVVSYVGRVSLEFDIQALIFPKPKSLLNSLAEEVIKQELCIYLCLFRTELLSKIAHEHENSLRRILLLLSAIYEHTVVRTKKNVRNVINSNYFSELINRNIAERNIILSRWYGKIRSRVGYWTRDWIDNWIFKKFMAYFLAPLVPQHIRIWVHNVVLRSMTQVDTDVSQEHTASFLGFEFGNVVFKECILLC